MSGSNAQFSLGQSIEVVVKKHQLPIAHIKMIIYQVKEHWYARGNQPLEEGWGISEPTAPLDLEGQPSWIQKDCETRRFEWVKSLITARGTNSLSLSSATDAESALSAWLSSGWLVIKQPGSHQTGGRTILCPLWMSFLRRSSWSCGRYPVSESHPLSHPWLQRHVCWTVVSEHRLTRVSQGPTLGSGTFESFYLGLSKTHGGICSNHETVDTLWGKLSIHGE